MANESTGSAVSSADKLSAADRELPGREDLEEAVHLKQEKISRGLYALRDEIRHIPVRQFIRDHPAAVTAVASLCGFGFGRWLWGRLGGGEPSPDEYRRRLMDELLEAVIHDAAHDVSTGASTQDAIRSAVRAHTPIVFEVERDSEEEAESAAAAAMHTLFALIQPYLQQYLRAQLDAFVPRTKEPR